MNSHINEKEIKNAINMMKDLGDLFEIRIIQGKTTYSGYFVDADKAINELRRMNLTGCNVFITLQQINSACYSRKQHDTFIKIFREPTTSDINITDYKWLLIDLDPERPAGISSSNEELKEAKITAQRVCSWLSDQGFEEPIITMSGNGYHLLYKIDLVNTDENKSIVERVLKSLDMLFSSDLVKVDTGVFNPARISKLYGTVAQKGASTEERPHRMSHIVKVPAEIRTTQKEKLKAVAAEFPTEKPKSKDYQRSDKKFDVYEFLNNNGIRYVEKQGKDYTKLILDECVFNPDHKAPDAMVTIATDGTLGYKCLHTSCSGNHWREFRLKLDPNAYDQESTRESYQKREREEKPKEEYKAKQLHFHEGQQLTMLGNWLKGNHREDIALFGAGIFTFKNLYSEVVKGGKTFIQLMAESKTDSVSLTEIETAIGADDIAESKYQEAKAEALLKQRDKLIDFLSRPGADVPYITEHLLKVQAAIDQREVKPAAANLADTLLTAIDTEASKTKLKFGRGFERLDKVTESMQRGQLVVLAGRPGSGKSAAALQIAYNVYDKGAKVLFFPLEMTTAETLERLVLQQEVIERAAIKAPREDEKEEVRKYLNAIEENGNFLIYEGVNDLEAIAQTIREQQPDLVVIDQLTQVRTARRTKDIRERYVEITADLKHLAIEYNTAILLLTQLNRESTKGSRPTLENLHESDATGQNADKVLLIWEKDIDDGRPEAAKMKELDIYVVKNRGAENNKVVSMKFAGSKYRFYGIGR